MTMLCHATGDGSACLKAKFVDYADPEDHNKTGATLDNGFQTQLKDQFWHVHRKYFSSLQLEI